MDRSITLLATIRFKIQCTETTIEVCHHGAILSKCVKNSSCAIAWKIFRLTWSEFPLLDLIPLKVKTINKLMSPFFPADLI